MIMNMASSFKTTNDFVTYINCSLLSSSKHILTTLKTIYFEYHQSIYSDFRVVHFKVTIVYHHFLQHR